MEFHKIDRLGDHHHTITMSELDENDQFTVFTRYLINHLWLFVTDSVFGVHQQISQRIIWSYCCANPVCFQYPTASICKKSAITDHVCNENHVIDWANAKVIDRESVTGSGG